MIPQQSKKILIFINYYSSTVQEDSNILQLLFLHGPRVFSNSSIIIPQRFKKILLFIKYYSSTSSPSFSNSAKSLPERVRGDLPLHLQISYDCSGIGSVSYSNCIRCSIRHFVQYYFYKNRLFITCELVRLRVAARL